MCMEVTATWTGFIVFGLKLNKRVLTAGASGSTFYCRRLPLPRTVYLNKTFVKSVMSVLWQQTMYQICTGIHRLATGLYDVTTVSPLMLTIYVHKQSKLS